MKTLTNAIALMIVAMVVVAIAYAGYWIGHDVWTNFSALNGELRTILSTALGGGLLISLLVIAGLRAAARTIAFGSLNHERLELYRQLYVHYQAVVSRGQGYADEDALRAWESELALLGSAQVLQTHQQLILGLGDASAQKDEVKQALGKLMIAMRRDLGQTRLDEGKLGETPRHDPALVSH